jgi:hypothetical protein
VNPGHTGWDATFASGAAAFLDLLDYMAPLNSCAQYSASNFPIYVERPLDRHDPFVVGMACPDEVGVGEIDRHA